MNKEKFISILTTLLVVVIGVIVANLFITQREVDSTGKVIPDGKAYKAKLGFKKK